MKILLINGRLYPDDISGPQKAMFELSQALAKYSDNELHIMSECKDEAKIQKSYNGIVMHTIKPERGNSIFSFFTYQWKFYQKLRSLPYNFDIIHFQNLTGGKFFLTCFLARKKAKKLVMTICDWPMLELKYYNLKEKVFHILHWWLSLLTFPLFNEFIVFSDFNKSILKRFVKKIHVVNVGFDEEYYDNLKNFELSDKKKDKNMILYFGALNKKKGLKYLLQALGYLRSGFFLTIAGDGPDSNELKMYCNIIGIKDKVKFAGFVTERKKAELMSRANIVVFPSEYEGYGIAILEALMHGCKVLTSDKGAQVEFQEHFRNLFLFKTCDYKDLAEKLAEIKDIKRARIDLSKLRNYTMKEVV